MRRRGNELLDATYSWDAIASRTVDVYLEVASSPASASSASASAAASTAASASSSVNGR
jgi:hypothetical protein